MPKLNAEGREKLRQFHATSKNSCVGCGDSHRDDCPFLLKQYEMELEPVPAFQDEYMQNQQGGIDFECNYPRDYPESAPRQTVRYFKFTLPLTDGSIAAGWRAEYNPSVI